MCPLYCSFRRDDEKQAWKSVTRTKHFCIFAPSTSEILEQFAGIGRDTPSYELSQYTWGEIACPRALSLPMSSYYAMHGSTRPTFSGLTELMRLASRLTEHIPSMHYFLRPTCKPPSCVHTAHNVANSPKSKVACLDFHLCDNCAASTLWTACS